MTGSGSAIGAFPCLALDVGATKVDVAVVSPGGRIGERCRVPVTGGGEQLLDAILAEVRARAMAQSVRCVGVGCAGPMTYGGELVSPLNISSWREFPLRRLLRDGLGLEVFVEGDARALALAEGAFGAARHDSSYLSMVVSTGVGGGIVLNGRLLDGDTGNAGHVGHLNVVDGGALCSCGARGCLEAEASGWAIEARTGRPPSEADQQTRFRTAELVGRAIGTLSSVLDFRRCYVAGSVALGYGEEFFATATKSARKSAMMFYSHDVTVLPSGLGRDGPLLGAALVGWRAQP